MKVVTGLILLMIVAIVSVFAAGAALTQYPSNINPVVGLDLLLAASAMLVGATSLWAISFLIVGIFLFDKIRSSTIDQANKRYVMVKLILGTFLGALLAIAYSVFFVQTIFISPLRAGDPAIFRTSTNYSWVQNCLNFGISIVMIWLIRPQSEAEKIVETDQREKTVLSHQSRQTSTMDIDD